MRTPDEIAAEIAAERLAADARIAALQAEYRARTQEDLRAAMREAVWQHGPEGIVTNSSAIAKAVSYFRDTTLDGLLLRYEGGGWIRAYTPRDAREDTLVRLCRLGCTLVVASEDRNRIRDAEDELRHAHAIVAERQAEIDAAYRMANAPPETDATPETPEPA